MKVIKYVGDAHVFQMSPQDWRNAGTKGPLVQWGSQLNSFEIDASTLTEDQLAALEGHADLTIVEQPKLTGRDRTGYPMTPRQMTWPKVDLGVIFDEPEDTEDDDDDTSDTVDSVRVSGS